ncbi:thioredoxin [Haloglomus irregulare]|jgi:thiol-disulfide isomerase/thioredoxin|uniref:Thioredoxin n=1 Tax=Haloglomus irregulare TaxID=2234134 RepID=A0A554N968_9EURY|nr:thioredoxin [Haloglomus irregulare]TSD13958.1 thioredoxin [Haloglomus irregulare]
MSEPDEAGRLETMRPNPTWDAESYDDAVETLAALPEDTVVRVWGGDWCKDCRRQLPDFGAALEAAGITGDRVAHYPVEKLDDGSKTGPLVEEYDIELIPTVVVESGGGTERARFVEEERVPVLVHLARQLDNR